MAKWIKVRKIKEIERQYYYQVSTEDFVAKEFYINIAPDEKKIFIYLSEDFNSLADYIDLDDLSKEIFAPGINRSLLFPAIAMALKAVQKNEFRDILDFCA